MSHTIYPILLTILAWHNIWIPWENVWPQMARNRIRSPPQRNRLTTSHSLGSHGGPKWPIYNHDTHIPGPDWYKNSSPHAGPFLDTHVLAHFAVDNITYEEPTIPPELNITKKESSTLQIFCIHHQNNHIGTYEQMRLLKDIAENLQILQSHTQIAPPTPSNITVNPSKNGLNQTTQIYSKLPEKSTSKIPPPIQLLHWWFLYETQRNCPWTMEKRKSWIWYLQSQRVKYRQKTTWTPKHTKSINDYYPQKYWESSIHNILTNQHSYS